VPRAQAAGVPEQPPAADPVAAAREALAVYGAGEARRVQSRYTDLMEQEIERRRVATALRQQEERRRAARNRRG
jgi:hypothetical protein